MNTAVQAFRVAGFALGAAILFWQPAATLAQNAPVRIESIIQRIDPGELPAGIELPPGVELPAGLRPNGGASKTNVVASPEEQRLQELLRLQFDRRGPA